MGGPVRARVPGAAPGAPGAVRARVPGAAPGGPVRARVPGAALRALSALARSSAEKLDPGTLVGRGAGEATKTARENGWQVELAEEPAGPPPLAGPPAWRPAPSVPTLRLGVWDGKVTSVVVFDRFGRY